MSISAIGAGSTVPNYQTVGDPELRQYDKQIEELQKKISELKADKKMDQQLKSETIAQYQRQIQDLQAQKAQRQMEKRGGIQPKEVKEELLAPVVEPPKTEEQEDREKTQILDKNTVAAFAGVDAAKATSAALRGVRQDLEGKLRVASTSSYGREVDLAETKKIAGELSVVNAREIGDWQKASQTVEKSQSDRVEKAGEAAGPEGARDREEQAEEAQEERRSGGTGRMEPGQFLFEEV